MIGVVEDTGSRFDLQKGHNLKGKEMHATDHTGMHGAEEGPEISPATSPAQSIIPVLWELASEVRPLPTYLTQQCGLDWHHISQVKWKHNFKTQVPSQGKACVWQQNTVGASVIRGKIPATGEAGICKEKCGRAMIPGLQWSLQKLPTLEDQIPQLLLFPGTLEKPDELWNNETGMLCFQNTCISYLKI